MNKIDGSCDSLHDNGVAIVKDEYFINNINKLVVRFNKTLKKFPEYCNKDIEKYVLGAFSALGNPGSFHNKFVRWIRLHSMRAVYPLFSEMIKDDDLYLAQLADRMMYRPPNVKTSDDTWHRDIKENQLPGETIYGGWINISTRTQYFSCVPGTHNDKCNSKGFAKIVDKKLIEHYENKKQYIEIPPGAILIFNERMVHEVLSNVVPYAITRIFLAWMTTPKKMDHFPVDIERRLNEQDIITIKSGQMPEMYPKTYITYHIDKLTEWATQNLKPEMLRLKKQNDDAKKFPGKTIKIPQNPSLSLTKMNLPLYPSYKKYEIDIFFANESHTLPRETGSKELQQFNLK